MPFRLQSARTDQPGDQHLTAEGRAGLRRSAPLVAARKFSSKRSKGLSSLIDAVGGRFYSVRVHSTGRLRGCLVACVCALSSLGAILPIPGISPQASAAGSVVVDVGSARVVEGNTTARTIAVPVLLSQAATATVTVEYQLVGGSATGGAPTAVGADFNNAKGVKKTLTFLAGQVAKDAVIPVYADTRIEGTETVRVLLSAATGGAVIGVAEGALTIVDDDPSTTRLVTAGDLTISEGDNTTRIVRMALNLNAPATQSVTVVYRVVAGTASTPSDFSNNKGLTKSLVFAVAASGFTPVHKAIALTVYADTTRESTETFDVQIVSVTGGASIASDTTGTVTITDGTESSVTEPATPAAPTVASTTYGNIAVSWVAPANGGSAITGYGISCVSSNGGTSRSMTSTTTSATFTNATVAKNYTCTVTASNIIGTSSPSAASNIVNVESRTAPDAPAAPTVANAGIGEIIVTWAEPADGGSPITSYEVVCFSETGGEPVGTDTTPDTTTLTFADASLGEDYTCNVFATNSFGTSNQSAASDLVTVLPRQFTQVSAGGFHVCGLTANQAITCWGDNGLGQTSAPSGRFIQVTSGYEYSCGLRTDQTLSCWGTNEGGQLDAQTGTFTQIDASWLHTCGLRTNQTIACWGDNGSGQLDVPAGTFTQVTTGDLVTCGVRTDQTLTCWGSNEFGQIDAPTGTFTQIDASWLHTCGLRTDQTIACWGYNGSGQATAPTGAFLQVDAGGYHSCGLTVDQEITCWGDNYYETLTAPTRTFTQVSADSEHSCGLTTEQTIVCWGDNTSGQTAAPTHEFFVPPDSPEPPSAVSDGIGEITVWWTAPAEGGSPITGYQVVCFSSGSGEPVGADTAGDVTEVLLAGATPGEDYTCGVFASNSYGTSEGSSPSAVVTVVGLSAPDTPAAPSVDAGFGEITVWWTAPADGGSPITGYQVVCFSSGSGEPVGADTAGDVTEVLLAGATPGEEYSCNVFASNDFGTSQQSPQSEPVTVLTLGAPNTPAAPSVSPAGRGEIVVTWDAPADGGSPITEYGITCISSNSGATRTTTAADTSTTVAEATIGADYTCTVRATNFYGTSDESLPSDSVGVFAAPPAAPDAPIATSSAVGQITVTWDAPSDDGGSPITEYFVDCRATVGGAAAQAFGVTGTTTMITDAIRDKSYRCTVMASNLYYNGAASLESEVVTVMAASPSTPAAPSVTAGGIGEINVTWVAPANGGSPITGYEVVCFSATGGEPAGMAAAAGATTATVLGASLGEDYTCNVFASNNYGTSSQSAASSVVTVLPRQYSQVAAGSSHSCALRSDQEILCWGDNTYGQTTAPTGTFTQISAGGDHTCGLRTSGVIHCWGKDTSGQSNAPTGTFTQVAAGNSHTCAVRTNQTVACWGSATDGKTTAPTGTFTQVAAGFEHSCGLTTAQTVTCWGGTAYYSQTDAPAGTFTSIDADGYHTCAISAAQTVSCWGYDYFEQATAPTGTFTQVAVGTHHSCGLTTGQTVACWGRNSSGQVSAPLGTFTQIDAGADHSCAVNIFPTVTCWGDNWFGQATPLDPVFQVVPSAPAAPSTTHGGYRELIVSWAAPAANASPITGYEVICYSSDGGTTRSATTTGATTATVTSLTIAKSYSCVVSASNVYGMGDQSLLSTPTALVAPAKQAAPIAATGDYGEIIVSWTPATPSNGQPDTSSPITGYGVTCDSLAGGAEVSTSTTANTSTVTLGNASLGTTYYCRLTATNVYGTNTISNYSNSVTVRELLFTQVSAGNSHTCGLTTEQLVLCWGDNTHGQTNAPTGTFTQIDAGDNHTCGLRTDQTLACWGRETGWWAGMPPAGQYSATNDYRFTQVSAGADHNCAITTAGWIYCWAYSLPDSYYEQPSGSFTQVSSGADHSCAVRLDQAVVCWAMNTAGQVEAPTGITFTQASASTDFTCAVRVGNTVTCWGVGYEGRMVYTPAACLIYSATFDYCVMWANDGVGTWERVDWPVELPTLGTITQIESGATRSCGINTLNDIKCWTPEFAVTQHVGTYTQVAVGSGHYCGVTSAGTITCWGTNTYGEATPPTG